MHINSHIAQTMNFTQWAVQTSTLTLCTLNEHNNVILPFGGCIVLANARSKLYIGSLCADSQFPLFFMRMSRGENLISSQWKIRSAFQCATACPVQYWSHEIRVKNIRALDWNHTTSVWRTGATTPTTILRRLERFSIRLVCFESDSRISSTLSVKSCGNVNSRQITLVW